jgi:hypothetical protein
VTDERPFSGSAVRRGSSFEQRESSSRGTQGSRTSQHGEGARSSHKEGKSLTQRFRSWKAERQFDRTVGAQEERRKRTATQPEGGSRAALYEMNMGRTHKRSARMQDENEGRRSPKRGAGILGVIGALVSGGRVSRVAAVTFAMLVFSVVMLYGPAADYYQELRSSQQLEAEYAAVTDYYNTQNGKVTYLGTEDGMADYIHQELGYIRSDEHSVKVEGLSAGAGQSTGSDGTDVVTLNTACDVRAPDTWYSGVLDVVFHYED